MNEKKRRTGYTAVNSKGNSKKCSIYEDHSSTKKKPNENNHLSQTLKNYPKNKRSLSQLQIIKPIKLKTDEGTSIYNSTSRNSLNYRYSIDRESYEDKFTDTFKNMFSHFSKLTEIMTNSSKINSDSFKNKSSRRSKCSSKLSGAKKLDTYEPLTERQKMNFLEEITRGSEQRMRAYNTIFNTIKSQICLISKREDEEDIEKDLLNTLKRNSSNLIIDNMTKSEEKTRDFTEKKFNIINNNITVNIISNDGKKPEIENISNIFPTALKEKMNPISSKGSGTSNGGSTYNDDIEEENKQNSKNFVVPSNAFKNKTDLENSIPFSLSRKSSNSVIQPVFKPRISTKLLNNESNFDDLDKMNKNLELRSTFLIAKSELNQNKLHKSSMNELRPKQNLSPRKFLSDKSNYNQESNSINSTSQEDISLDKKNCMII